MYKGIFENKDFRKLVNSNNLPAFRNAKKLAVVEIRHIENNIKKLNDIEKVNFINSFIINTLVIDKSRVSDLSGYYKVANKP